MAAELNKWRDDGGHLPDFMRDFHDQKNLFKAIAAIPPPASAFPSTEVSWMQAHVYTIDRFLWFMARHGYVLRKADNKLPFDDIEKTNAAAKAAADKAIAAALGLTPVR